MIVAALSLQLVAVLDEERTHSLQQSDQLRQAELAVAAEANRLHPRIPLAPEWLAQALFAKGLPIAEISRRLHKSDTAVRRYISAETRAETRQLSLPL